MREFAHERIQSLYQGWIDCCPIVALEIDNIDAAADWDPKTDMLVDAYCSTGEHSLCMAHKVKQILAFDNRRPKMTSAGVRRTQLAGINNITFRDEGPGLREVGWQAQCTKGLVAHSLSYARDEADLESVFQAFNWYLKPGSEVIAIISNPEYQRTDGSRNYLQEYRPHGKGVELKVFDPDGLFLKAHYTTGFSMEDYYQAAQKHSFEVSLDQDHLKVPAHIADGSVHSFDGFEEDCPYRLLKFLKR